MSLKPRYLQEIPEETQEVACAAFPKGNIYIRMRDEFGTLYKDELFGGLYSPTGQPGIAAWRLALVTVMQFCEGLTDREAAEAVRGRIDWKYALGLELRDPGFDFSVLSEFRDRLIAGGMDMALLDVFLEECKARGWVKARGRQRTDSTHVLAAIHTLQRLEQVGQTLQHALDDLAQVAPLWLKSQVPSEWFNRYGRKLEEHGLPKGDTKRLELAVRIGQDGQQLLGWLDNQEVVADLRQRASVEILRQVWSQHYALAADGTVRWREKQELLPSAERIASPHDPEARYSTKNGMEWVGYKVHVTECCEANLPHLITHVETTPATDQDIEAVPTIHAALARRNLLPSQHIVDTGYMSGERVLTSQLEYGIDLVGPMRPDVSWQAQQPDAFDLSHFQIDWSARQVTCPGGKTSYYWKPQTGSRDNPVIEIQFRKSECGPCSLRSLCTRSKTGPRNLTVPPQPIFEALQSARARQQTQDFKLTYNQRTGIEGTLSEAVNPLDMRRSRYLGLRKTRLQHIATSLALNMTRLFAWLTNRPLAKTRISPFAALAT